MTFLLLSTILAFSALIVGSISDLRTREVPDWVNYGLLAAAFALRIIASITAQHWLYLWEGLLGFAAMVAFAYLIFYTGQMGGGDAKLLMAMGMLLGLPWSISASMDSTLLAFLMNSLIVGAVYGMLWSMALALRHWRGIRRAIREIFSHPRMRRIRMWGLISSCIALLAAFLAPMPFRVIGVFAVLLYLVLLYCSVFVRAVEAVCMRKQLRVSKLTPGDWIPKDIIINGKRIVGPKDLGISAQQIALLKTYARQRKIKTVLVKEGVPFVPSFCIAYAATLLWGNVLLRLFAL